MFLQLSAAEHHQGKRFNTCKLLNIPDHEQKGRTANSLNNEESFWGNQTKINSDTKFAQLAKGHLFFCWKVVKLDYVQLNCPDHWLQEDFVPTQCYLPGAICYLSAFRVHTNNGHCFDLKLAKISIETRTTWQEIFRWTILRPRWKDETRLMKKSVKIILALQSEYFRISWIQHGWTVL